MSNGAMLDRIIESDAFIADALREASMPPLEGATSGYLASSASDFMCGSVIAVDGGFVAQ